MDPNTPFAEPMDVTEHDGEIIVNGPGGIHGSFLPSAAKESGQRLLAAVQKMELKKAFEQAAENPPRHLLKQPLPETG